MRTADVQPGDADSVEVAEYRLRGRRFGLAPDDTLRQVFELTVKGLAVRPDCGEWWDMLTDAQSEFEIRGIEPPAERVKVEQERLHTLAIQAVGRLRTDLESRRAGL